MVGSRVFWKIVPSYAAVVTVTALVVGVGVGRRVEHSTLAGIEGRDDAGRGMSWRSTTISTMTRSRR